MKVVGPRGIIGDNRTTENSNVGLTEKPLSYSPSDPKKATNAKPGTLATFDAALIQDYPGRVHHVRLQPTWNKDPYWGSR